MLLRVGLIPLQVGNNTAQRDIFIGGKHVHVHTIEGDKIGGENTLSSYGKIN